MTEKEFESLQVIKNRIEILEEEVYALIGVRQIRVNPFKPFRIRGFTKKSPDFPKETEITLSLEDLNILLNVREKELSTLRKIISEDKE